VLAKLELRQSLCAMGEFALIRQAVQARQQSA
jgi:hypothetical protein